jgi:hypothetical protein
MPQNTKISKSLAYICSRNRHYDLSPFLYSLFNKPYYKLWGKHFFEGGKCLLQVFYDSLSPVYLWAKSCNTMDNIQIVSYANDSSITNPHHQAKLMEIIKDFFSDNEVHELQEVLNETYSDAMDSKWWNEYSKKRKKDRHLSLSILTKFLSHLEVLNYKMRCHG